MNYYLAQAKWDSFRVEIPKAKVTNLSHIGKEIIKSYKETGEIVDGDDAPLVEMSIAQTDRGIKYRYALTNVPIGFNQFEERYVIQVNSKMLMDGYFEGINNDNIKKIYDYLISQKILDFSFEDFLDGYCYDADACYDVNSDVDTWILLLKKVNASVYFTKERYVEAYTKQKTNVGLSFNNRKMAKPTSPFLKFYHKGLELDFNSYDFNDAFIKKHGLEIGRFEFNFKSRKHFQHHKIEVKTLRDLLDLDKEVVKSVILSACKTFYLQKRIVMNNTDSLGPKDFYIKYLVGRLIDYGEGQEFFHMALKHYKDDTGAEDMQLSRLKQYITKSLDEEFFQAQLKQNNKVESIGRELNLF